MNTHTHIGEHKRQFVGIILYASAAVIVAGYIDTSGENGQTANLFILQIYNIVVAIVHF